MKMSSSDSKEGYNPRVTDVHEIQVNVQEISLLLEELKRIKGLKTKIIYENSNSNDDISCNNSTKNKIHENSDGVRNHQKDISRRNSRKYQCERCSKEFANNYRLKRHVKIHKSPPLADENEIHKNLSNDESKEIHVRHPVDDHSYESNYDDEIVDTVEENDNSAEIIKQENIFDDEDFCNRALQFEEKFFSKENINVDEQEIDIKDNLKSEVDYFNSNGGEEEMYDDLQDEEHLEFLENDIFFKKEEPLVGVDNLDAEVELKLYRLDHKCLQLYQSTKSYGQKKKLLQSLCNIQDRKETLGVLKQPYKISDNNWVCHICYNTFSSKNSVQNHVREYHIRVSTFKCNACKFVTSSMKQLNFHTQNEHMDEKKFRCPECENYTTMVKRSLIGHLMKIHNLNDNEATERYKNLPSSRCPFCPVTFKHKRSGNIKSQLQVLERHVRDHHDKDFSAEIDLKCGLCQTQFLLLEFKRKHACQVKIAIMSNLKLKFPEQPYICPLCDTTKLVQYVSLKDLTGHYIDIHGPSCPEAQEFQKSRGTFAWEMKLISCNLCKRRFDTGEECDLHLTSCAVFKMIEKNISKPCLLEKILECPLCHLNQESEESLKEHYINSHGDDCPEGIKYQELRKHENEIRNKLWNNKRKYTTIKEMKAILYNDENNSPEVIPKSENSSSFNCKMCEYVGASEELLSMHVKVVHIHTTVTNFKFICNICGHQTKSQLPMTKHKRLVHKIIEESPLKCDSCNKSFAKHETLKRHIKYKLCSDNPLPIPRMICDECGKSFTTSGQLRAHVNYIHEGGPKIICDECSKSFSTASRLRTHVKIVHEGRKDYKCESCGKLFAQASILKGHIHKVHEGHKDFKCDSCEKSFTEVHNLESHIRRIHVEGTRDHKCDSCDKSFLIASKLMQHKFAVHQGAGKEFFCETCGKSYWTSAYLRTHMKRSHEDRIKEEPGTHQCETCGKNLSSRLCLKKHIKVIHDNIRPFQCNYCGKAFTQKCKLDHHILDNHEQNDLSASYKNMHHGLQPTCHLCHQNGIFYQCMNERVFARHLSYHHAILNPDEELSNKDNREIIWNPPKLPKMDNETRRFLLFEQRRALGITKGKRRPVHTIQDAPRIPGDDEHKCNLCYVEGDKKGAFHEKKELLKHQRKYHPEHFPKSEYRFTCDLCFVEGGKKGIFYGKNNFLKHQSKNHPEQFT